MAREPGVKTPIGIAIDGQGRVYVIESNTHFRPDDYEGPSKDVIKRFEDKDGDGLFESSAVFAEGLTHAMNLAFSPNGVLHVVERNRVLRLEDLNGDGRADKPKDIVWLETQGSYPHDGLAGIVFGPDGDLYVGFGENFGFG